MPAGAACDHWLTPPFSADLASRLALQAIRSIIDRFGDSRKPDRKAPPRRKPASRKSSPERLDGFNIAAYACPEETQEKSSGGRRVARAALVGVVLVLLGGCAAMSEQECLSTDWYERGVADGRAGYPPGRIDSYREACAQVQIRPDIAQWEQGREVGLEEYCQLPEAVQRGLDRYSYARVCSDPNYERLYTAAKALGDARHQIESIDSSISSLERDLLNNNKLDDKKRDELRAEIRNLERQRDRARDDRGDAERQLDRLRTELGV